MGIREGWLLARWLSNVAPNVKNLVLYIQILHIILIIPLWVRVIEERKVIHSETFLYISFELIKLIVKFVI